MIMISMMVDVQRRIQGLRMNKIGSLSLVLFTLYLAFVIDDMCVLIEIYSITVINVGILLRVHGNRAY
jgi:hypothetical protein